MAKSNEFEEGVLGDSGSRKERLGRKKIENNNLLDSEDKEALDAQIEYEIDCLNILLNELENKVESLKAEESKDEEVVEIEKEILDFSKKIEKAKKVKKKDKQLEKLLKIKEEIEKSISGEEIEIERGEEVSGDEYLEEKDEVEEAHKKMNKDLAEGLEDLIDSDKDGQNKNNNSELSEKKDVIGSKKVNGADTKKEALNDFDELKKDLNESLEDFEKKFVEFKKAYPKKKSFHQQIKDELLGYGEKIEKIDKFKKAEYGEDTFVEANQLLHEMQKKLDRDWVDLYKTRTETEADKKEDKETSKDFNESGDNEDVSSEKDLKDIFYDRKINDLKEEYGEVGTVYFRNDKKTGFPIDSYIIKGYIVGKNPSDNFVKVERSGNIVDIPLKNFKKNIKGFLRESDNNFSEKISSSEESEKSLSKEQLEAKNMIIDGFKDFPKDLEKDSDWEGYIEKEKDKVILILTKVEVRKALRDAGVFADEDIDNNVLRVVAAIKNKKRK
jgi:hypothetical protein